MSALGMMVHTYCSYSNMRADFFRVVGARSWSRIVGDSIAGWDGFGGSYPAEGAFPLSLPDTASQPYGETPTINPTPRAASDNKGNVALPVDVNSLSAGSSGFGWAWPDRGYSQ